MGVIGTNGNDRLSKSGSWDFVAGLAGNDIINVGYTPPGEYIAAFGGSGNDIYELSYGSSVMVADCGGDDTIKLPFTENQLNSYIQTTVRGIHKIGHAVSDGKHYFIETEEISLFIVNYREEGRIETISTRDGFTYSFDDFLNKLKPIELEKFVSYPETQQWQRTLKMFEYYEALKAVEGIYAQHSTQPWFDDAVYMQNKAKATGMTAAVLKDTFESARFYGKDGDFLHFVHYGQWEDISPIANFDADYYYKSKAAELYKLNIGRVTAQMADYIKSAIHDAGLNAWSHYSLYGTREGVDASANFDTSAYMEAKLAQMRKGNPGYTMDQLCTAFAEAGLSAAAHYEAYGKAEGLKAVGVPSSALGAVALDAHDLGA